MKIGCLVSSLLYFLQLDVNSRQCTSNFLPLWPYYFLGVKYYADCTFFSRTSNKDTVMLIILHMELPNFVQWGCYAAQRPLCNYGSIKCLDPYNFVQWVSNKIRILTQLFTVVIVLLTAWNWWKFEILTALRTVVSWVLSATVSG